MSTDYRLGTLALHAGQVDDPTTHARAVPISPSPIACWSFFQPGLSPLVPVALSLNHLRRLTPVVLEPSLGLLPLKAVVLLRSRATDVDRHALCLCHSALLNLTA